MPYILQFGKSDTLAADITLSETSGFSLSAGNFTNMTDDFLVIDNNVPAKREVIKCTVAGTAVTSITRGQEGTSAVAHSAGASIIYAFVPSHYSALSGGGSAGTDWISAGETWTYVSADDPAGSTHTWDLKVTGADQTDVYSAGMKIKLTQSATVKYFIVTKVSLSGSDTLIKVFGGTTYTLANSEITANYYSTTRAPYGFPMNPTLWTLETTSTTSRIQSPGTANTWYNAENLMLSVGMWQVYYKARGGMVSGGTHGRIAATLSTANNSESDVDLTSSIGTYVYNDTQTYAGGTLSASKTLNITTTTTYYLNWKSVGQSLSTAGIRGDWEKTIIRATCSYL